MARIEGVRNRHIDGCEGDAATARAIGTATTGAAEIAPANIEQVRFALGSCRKIYTNSADALALLDEALAANVNSTSGRPQILMLGGDQI